MDKSQKTMSWRVLKFKIILYMLNNKVAEQLIRASREVHEELLQKAYELERTQNIPINSNLWQPTNALQHAVLQVSALVSYVLMDTNVVLAPREKWVNLIDLSLGDCLNMIPLQFKNFCKGEGLDNPTFQILFEFRNKMLLRLDQILQEAKKGLN